MKCFASKFKKRRNQFLICKEIYLFRFFFLFLILFKNRKKRNMIPLKTFLYWLFSVILFFFYSWRWSSTVWHAHSTCSSWTKYFFVRNWFYYFFFVFLGGGGRGLVIFFPWQLQHCWLHCCWFVAEFVSRILWWQGSGKMSSYTDTQEHLHKHTHKHTCMQRFLAPTCLNIFH